MGGARPGIVALALGAALIASCRTPTEITLAVSTDVKCTDLRGFSITAGRLGEIEGEATSTSSTFCDASGNLGTLVVVPSGDNGDKVAFKVIAGFARDVASCTPPYGKGCIVARRSLRYIPHTELRVLVALRAACDGIPCGETETCVNGVCEGAEISDPGSCSSAAGCGDEALGPPSGGGADAGPDPDGAAGDASDAAVTDATDASIACVGKGDAGLGIVTTVAAGNLFTCAIRVDGTTWCWGYGAEGQLGDGKATSSPIPVQVSTLAANAVDVRAGGHHACARDANATLWCWGQNLSGQLGDGTTAQRSAPVAVPGFSASTAEVSTGDSHTCAVKTDGSLWCWGDNVYGKLGDGTTTARSSPVKVAGLGANVASVSAGFVHTCARKTDGTLWCWGDNLDGEFGNGTQTSSLTPVQVTALGTTVAEVTTGDLHTCARKTDGTMWCWGPNSFGQLGDGSMTQRLTPVPVTALGASVVEVSAAAYHSCARKTDGTVWCWGSNSAGQLGDGTMATQISPVPVVGLPSAVGFSAGPYHGCAREPDGTVWCWGSDTYGQLGDGTTTGGPATTAARVPCP